MTYVTNGPEETEALGAALAGELSPGTVLAFTGDLGRGRPPSSGAWPGGWASPAG